MGRLSAMRLERWIILIAALAAAAGTARLGWWQLDRAAQKNAMQQRLDARRHMPALPQAELAETAEQAASQHHRSIELRGRWIADATVFLENRPMDGRVGFLALTPLRLADGSAVIVQRGWLPRDNNDRSRVSAPPVPAGEVTLRARVAPPPGRLYEFESAGSGAIRQNLDLASFAQEIRHTLRPLSVLQETGRPAPNDGLLRQWPAPAADVHKHYGYAFQWFALSALIVGLYVWFQIIRARRPARREH